MAFQENNDALSLSLSLPNAHDGRGFSPSFFSFTNPSMNVVMEKHMQEVEMFLSVPNEKFKSIFHRLAGQHMQHVTNKFESGVACMLKKKDEEIANAITTVTALKNHVFKLKGENFLWKKVAKDNGADLRTLKGELERMKREIAAAGDAGSECCGSSNPEMLIPCRICGSRDSCMMMLPCRHMCSCRNCDMTNQLCPVCNSVKTASVEVLFP